METKRMELNRIQFDMKRRKKNQGKCESNVNNVLFSLKIEWSSRWLLIRKPMTVNHTTITFQWNDDFQRIKCALFFVECLFFSPLCLTQHHFSFLSNVLQFFVQFKPLFRWHFLNLAFSDHRDISFKPLSCLHSFTFFSVGTFRKSKSTEKKENNCNIENKTHKRDIYEMIRWLFTNIIPKA